MAPWLSHETKGLSNGQCIAKSCLLVGLGQRTRDKAIPSLLKLAKYKRVCITGAVDSLVQTTPIDGLLIYPRIEDFFRINRQPSMAYVAVPHNEYAKILPELFRTGTDVLKEKPIACNSSQARELKRLAEAGGVQLGVLCQKRFSKRYNMLERWLPCLEGSVLFELPKPLTCPGWMKAGGPTKHWQEAEWYWIWATICLTNLLDYLGHNSMLSMQL